VVLAAANVHALDRLDLQLLLSFGVRWVFEAELLEMEGLLLVCAQSKEAAAGVLSNRVNLKLLCLRVLQEAVNHEVA